jgi:hypothetical protein
LKIEKEAVRGGAGMDNVEETFQEQQSIALKIIRQEQHLPC